jgi:hypothetical protein
MADVDVSAEIDILADPTDVAAVMFDPAREPEWLKAVTGVEVLDPALVPGAKVRHTGSALGTTVSWVTEVEAVHFPHLLTLSVVDGPFVGTVRYDVQRSPGGTMARIRNVGAPRGASFVPTAFIAGPLQSALNASLSRLKEIVERERA